uniref:Headcase middle domain-containing protein n=1 Tax=Anopheles coluzzii TaxID=1518534 RepID=A0A8W7PQH7_ANOCL
MVGQSVNFLKKNLKSNLMIEDEGNHGNDETRLFILSSLAAQHKSRVACVLCEEPMLVFDRYPLVDGTFFLSPKQHNKGCIEVKYENRVQYLTSVCMACLEGVEPNRIVRCRFCVNKWDGSSLVLGTMYSYDIFAAMPCCTERLKCNNCFKLMLSPHQRLNFYSDYSHSVSCPYCSAQDNHFVKPLSYCYTKQPMHGSLADATGRQEQQSPFSGSSASCSASTSALADKASADSAAMSSFIQELRHLSNSSTISNISCTSNDSGVSTSYCGDSNVGSGRAAATNLSNNNSNMQIQPSSSAMNSHQPQPNCKPTELYTPWTTSTASVTPSTMVPSQMQPSLLPPSITPTQNNDNAILSKTTLPSSSSSIFSTGNLSTNIWESKLGLVSGPQQSLEPLESIWSAPEPSSAAAAAASMIGGLTGCEQQQQRGGDAVPNGGPNAWRSDVPSAARDPYAIGSQFLRADESKIAGRLPGGTGDAIDTTPKLSSLWTPGPWSNAVDSAANSGSNISVLRSLRMGGSACSTTTVPSGSTSNSEAGNIVAKGLESNARPGENTEVSTNSFLPAGSEDVMNYLSIFN